MECPSSLSRHPCARRCGPSLRNLVRIACRLLLAAPAPGNTETIEIDPASSRSALTETGNERDHLTGDWGGLRTRLLDRGLHFQAGYIGESMTVLRGGQDQGSAADGVFDAGLELNFARLTHGHWSGGRLRGSALWLHGSSPQALAGDNLGLSNIDGFDTIRLYELWLEQFVAKDRVMLRAGQQVVDGEFATSTYAGVFVHGNFGWPSHLAANTRNNGPAYPVGALGAMTRGVVSIHWAVQAGVFDGDSYDSLAGDPAVNAHGVHFKINSGQGALTLAESIWQWNQEPAELARPGRFKIGAWRHTGSFETHGKPGKPGELDGVYALVEQLLWRESDLPESSPQGLGMFLRAGFSPGPRPRYNWVLDGGWNYHGLIPGRDNDTLGLGFVHARVNDSLRAPSDDVSPAPRPDHETAVELAYRFQVTPWWTLQPGLQYIAHPGSSPALDDAIVVGFRTSLTF